MATVCGNCRTPQGPFTRTVVPLTTSTLRLPAKNQYVVVTCGFRKGEKPTPEQRKQRAVECNARRAALEAKGALR